MVHAAAVADRRGPDGQEMPNPGVYLDVVPGEFTFADVGRDTSYAARVRHWSVEDREAHEKMGFHHGRGIATDPLSRRSPRRPDGVAGSVAAMMLRHDSRPRRKGPPELPPTAPSTGH